MEPGHSIARRYVPPTWRSTSAAGQVKPLGHHHCLSCSGSVNASKTRSGEALRVRSMTSCLVGIADRTSTATRVSGIGVLLLRGCCSLGGKMCVETVEAVGPFRMGAAEPVVHREQAVDLQSRRTALTITTPADEPSVLQHLEVLGDGGLRERGCCCEFDDAGLP